MFSLKSMTKLEDLTVYNKNIFKQFFLETSPIYYVLTMHFKPLKIFQFPNSIYIFIRR